MVSNKDSIKPLEETTDLGGMFYPVGCILVAFPDEAQARTVSDELQQLGFDDASCRFYAGAGLARIARKELERNTGWLAKLGKSRESVQMALEAADTGAAFLLVRAADDAESDRVMSVVRRGPFRFAHRYHAWAIELLEEARR